MAYPPPPDGFVTMADALRITGFGRTTIDAARAKGELDYYQRRNRGPVYFLEADLVEWARPQKVSA